MAQITLEKTWQRWRGVTVGVTSYTFALAMIKMKNLLVASGHWTLTQSSNSISAGATDYWTTHTSIVAAADGVAHSWVVLRNTEMFPGNNFEVCINFNSTLSQASVYCSHHGFSADGTTTTRPTAVGSEVIVTDKQTYDYSPALNWKVLVLTSSDGACTRVLFTNETTGTSGCCGVWHFEKMKNAPAWLTYPYVAIACPTIGNGDYSFFGGRNFPTYASFCHATGGIARCYHTTPIKVTFGCIGVTTAFGLNPIGRICRSDTGACPIYPVYVVSQSTSVPGFLGEMYDLYWLPSNVGDDAPTILYIPTMVCCPLIYLPTTDSEMGMFNWGAWAYGDTGEGGLF
jgi:hypothetical protein